MELKKNTQHDVKREQLISIIVPVYNVCNYFEHCLHSLLAQTYENTEILLVDDGSTDGSSTLCDQVALIDKRVEVIHQENKGLSDARNTGTSCAHGNWIVYVDSDDVVSPNFLEHLYAAARLNHSDVAICRGHVFAESERFQEVERNRVTVLDRDAAITELLSERNASTAAWGKLAKSSIWKSLPFPEGRKFEDLPVTWKALCASDSVAILDGDYYGYRNRKTSISNSPGLNSIVDYDTSIQQIWTELKPSSNKQLRAKCFRCCLERCRLLEMIDRLTDSTTLGRDAEQILSRTRKCSAEFLRQYGAKAVGNSSASFSQRLRIAVTAIFPRVSIMLMNLRE